MKKIKIWFTFILFFLWYGVFSQPLGYYNGTENLTGGQLKSVLHEIINNHVDFSYYFAKKHHQLL